ncbi:sensor histidine kinase [Paenibacillus hamazuiensis]|uniref:sensor histidine kinase n=1 Tax=Paenibacillus hamazuiensis TaxID=2936508 RepID=UPI00200E091A|nr:sensor histidine kinase [Paenibacillus hamazuiensis]
MNRHRFAGIQWKAAFYSLGLSLFISIVSMIAVLSAYRLDFSTLWSLHASRIGMALVLIVGLGLVPGYIFGSRLKRRVQQLAESVYLFERGDFTYRVPDSLVSGRDEMGVMGGRLNRMAERIEQQVASLQKLAAEKTELAGQLQQSAVLEERQRIARDLHDAVSQQLFAISMMTSAIRESEDLNTDKVRKRIEMVQSSAGEAQKEMRALLMQLRPAALDGKNLKDGIEELLRQLANKHDIAVHGELEDIPEISKGISDNLFRMLQESLSNVIRHSGASAVTVRLRQVGRHIHMTVADNGVGFDTEEAGAASYGMKTLQERADEIGGTVSVASSPGKGTQIHVKVPVIYLEGGS